MSFSMNVGARDLERVARDGVAMNALLMQSTLPGRDACEIEAGSRSIRARARVRRMTWTSSLNFAGSSEIFSAMKLARDTRRRAQLVTELGQKIGTLRCIGFHGPPFFPDYWRSRVRI